MKKILVIILILFSGPAWAEQNIHINFRCDSNYPPFEFIGENGRIEGFNIDLIREISNLMNLDIKIFPGKWSVVRKDLEDGVIDGITGMYFSEVRDQKVDFSIPFLITYHTIFERKGSVIQLVSQLQGKEVVVQKSDFMDDYLTSLGITDKIIRVNNPEEGLRELSEGRHDCAVIEKDVGAYLIKKNNLKNIIQSGPPILPKKYCVAVKEGNLGLLAKINEGLLAVQSTEKYNEIYDKWLGKKIVDPWMKLFIMYILIILGVVVAIAVAVAVWNRQLYKKVREKTQKLVESENIWKTLTHNSPDYIVLVYEDFRIAFANFIPRFSVPNDSKKKYVYEYLPEKDRKRIIRILNDVLKTEKMAVFELEFEIEGIGLRVYETRAVAIDLGDDQKGILLNSRNITERKNSETALQELNEELEKRVAERTEDLTASNSELEFFTYSVSHDLRAPLRHIISFVDILKDELASNSGGEIIKYVDKISKSSKKMAQLIDDILRFSRLGKSVLNKSKINSNVLVEDIIDDLMAREKDREIEWIIKPLPVIVGDKAMVNQVFVNILSNAVKYTCKTKNPKVEISVRTLEENKIEFCIKDNGIGFDMKYYDKLFGVFERLHSGKEFGGTGIGLAFVKRIVEKHGGKVWAESVPGKGAKFYFYF